MRDICVENFLEEKCFEWPHGVGVTSVLQLQCRCQKTSRKDINLKKNGDKIIHDNLILFLTYPPTEIWTNIWFLKYTT